MTWTSGSDDNYLSFPVMVVAMVGFAIASAHFQCMASENAWWWLAYVANIGALLMMIPVILSDAAKQKMWLVMPIWLVLLADVAYLLWHLFVTVCCLLL